MVPISTFLPAELYGEKNVKIDQIKPPVGANILGED